MRFSTIPALWVGFVNQNKAAESKTARRATRRSYEAAPGRGDRSPCGSGTCSAVRPHRDDRSPRLRCRRPKAPPASGASGELDRPPELAAPPRTDEAAENTFSLMSEVLADFLKPLDRKRKHTAKGRAEAAPVIQLAVDFLGNPRMDELTRPSGSCSTRRCRTFPTVTTSRGSSPRRCFSAINMQNDKKVEARAAGCRSAPAIGAPNFGSSMLVTKRGWRSRCEGTPDH
jgi:hypothetical protein